MKSTTKSPAVNTKALPASLLPIELAARAFSDSRMQLAAEINELSERIAALKKERASKLKAVLRQYNQMQADLRSAIEAAPKDLFDKPRTRQLHGIKVGYVKQPGKLVLQFDDVRTIELIEKHFKDQYDVLVRVKRTPNLETLAELPASDLKRLGGHIADADDKIVMTAIDSDIDKLIKALTGDVALTEETP